MRLPAYIILIIAAGSFLASCGKSGSGTGSKGDKDSSPQQQTPGADDRGIPKYGEQIQEGQDLAAALESMTGAATKVVWSWHQNPDKADAYTNGNNHKLVGISTRDGKGVRVILDKKSNYSRPMMTPDGEMIVYSDRGVTREGGTKTFAPRIFKVNWDGSGQQELCDGFAVDVWRDQESGVTWIYALEKLLPAPSSTVECESLFRFDVEKPEIKELVWDKTTLTPDNIQLSRDGSRASALFPWPNGGTMNLVDKKWTKLEEGCWTSMAPDNSYISWVFDGPHKNLRLFKGNGDRMGTLALSTTEGMEGHEVYHPRWSNHPLFIAFTGPYKGAKEGQNMIGKGGQDAEIVIAKLKPDLSEVEKTIKLTNNATGDFFPDLWIADGKNHSLQFDQGDVVPSGNLAKKQWPVEEVKKDLVFLWDNAMQTNAVENQWGDTMECKLRLNRFTRYHSYRDLNLDAGFATADELSNKALARVLPESDEFTIEATITESVNLSDVSQNIQYRFLGYETSGGDLNFALYRMNHALVFSALLEKEGKIEEFRTNLGNLTIENHRPWHILLSFRDGAMDYYLDGTLGQAVRMEGFSIPQWEEGVLKVGDPSPLGFGLLPRAEGIAIYGKGLSEAQATKNFSAVDLNVNARLPTSQIRFKGKLVESNPVPTVKSLEGYRRALVRQVYEVEEVISGYYKEPRILVLQWAILDQEVVQVFPQAEGESYEIVVEHSRFHPQIEAERTMGEINDFDLEQYYDVTRLTPNPPVSKPGS